MNSSQSLARVGGGLALLALPGVATAQSGGGAQVGLGTRIAIRFVVVLVLNLVLGGALLAFGSRYATERVEEIHNAPGETFVWGLAIGLGGPVLLVLLAITIIGLIVAIPGAIVFMLVGLVGNAVAILWVGDLIVGGTGRPSGTTVGAGALALAVVGAIPVLGNLLTTLVGTFGIGAVGRDLYRSRRGNSRANARPDRSRRGRTNR